MIRLSRLLSCLVLLVGILILGIDPVEAARARPTTPVFVDTDIGVDDAVAIAYLLRERSANIIGFTTVFGNTSVDNATRNLLTLLDVADVEEPVTVGAAEPRAFPRPRGSALVHGPDGLWFQQRPYDISTLPADAPAAIAAAARANPGLVIIALGPLTNLAAAVEQYPDDLAGVRLIFLGGGTYGNRTPVAETNAFNDPQALEIVLDSAMEVEIITLDAFNQVRIEPNGFAARLEAEGGEVGALLGPAVRLYAAGQQLREGNTIPIPDAAAVIHPFRPQLAEPLSALVKLITDGGIGRGQTVIATTMPQRISLITTDEELSALADRAFLPGFDLQAEIASILGREPDNSQVILDVQGPAMARLLARQLTR